MDGIKKLENISDAKIETFENAVKTLKKCLSEKDDYILSFKTRLELLEKRNNDVQKKADSEKVENVSKDEIKCTVCDFTTTSKYGHKEHRTKLFKSMQLM